MVEKAIYEIMLDLKKDEGFSGKPYADAAGRTTIGFGRNLDARPLTMEEGEFLLINDIRTTIKEMKYTEGMVYVGGIYEETGKKLLQIVEAEKILVNMAFNLGVTDLMEFEKMLKALEVFDFKTAAKEMLDSKWAVQVGIRAIRLAKRMRQIADM